jgi:hypothetical protein
MTRAQLMQALIDADGAILYWQLPRDAVESAVIDGVAYRDAESDLLVHQDAIANGDGSYSMPNQETCQHRDSGRGVCIDCGKFL